MPGAVAQTLDGITVLLADGTKVRCQPPTLRAARTLMEDYRCITAPPLPADVPVSAREADERRRQQAMDRLLASFPAAVAASPEAEQALVDRLTPGDVLNILPGFFWKGAGARLEPPADPAPATAGPSTGTPSGTASGATTGRPSA